MIPLIDVIFAVVFLLAARTAWRHARPLLRVGWAAIDAQIKAVGYNGWREDVERRRALEQGGAFLMGGIFWLAGGLVALALGLFLLLRGLSIL